MIRKWKKFPFSWLLPVLFFAALWLLGTTGIYNDSNQYIAMHIHREPLYSFFLWIFRSLFGETRYLDIVRFLQNGLAAFSVIWLAESLKKRFAFGQWMEALVCLILLAPHIITPVFSASGLVLSNGVISEALGLPLFYLFTAQCMKMVYTRQRGAALSSLLLSLFLSLVRGQMMFTILLWLVFAGAVVIVEKKKLAKRLLICVVCTALAFGTRTLLVKSYNLVFNGYFINNTFGSVGLLANILYAADEEDAERIADRDARVMFELSYRLAKEQGATYQDAPEGFFNRAAHLEKWHDAIKFEMIEEPWRQLHDREGFIDYIPENVESDRIAATIVKSLLPAVLGRWLYDYLALLRTDPVHRSRTPAAKLVCSDGVPRLYRAGCPCMEEKSQFQRGLAGGIFPAGCVSKRICYLHDHHVPFPLCDLWIAAVLCQRTDAFVRTGGGKNRASTAVSSPAPFAIQ